MAESRMRRSDRIGDEDEGVGGEDSNRIDKF